MRRLFFCCGSIWLVLCCPNSTPAASPRLQRILPRGVQRGAEHLLTFQGEHLGDTEEVLFYGPGMEVLQVEASEKAAKVNVRVSSDCRLGDHVLQLRTRSGVSDFRTLFVGELPAIDEIEPNSDFAAPQAISPNVTVQGIIEKEDVDYFVVDASAGERLTVEIEAMRLGSAMFDPYIAILDTRRFELAACDDTPLALQDGFASILVPETGRYVLEVREAAYGGSGDCRYRLHVGTFPRPTAVFPAGGPIGETLTVRFLGDASGEMEQSITLPSEPMEQYGLFATDSFGIAPSANPFRLVEFGNAFETEPNDKLPQATPTELPLAMNGIIGKPNDVDCFRFSAKKGSVFEVECYARRIRSGLDPVVHLHSADGRRITGNDDAARPR